MHYGFGVIWNSKSAVLSWVEFPVSLSGVTGKVLKVNMQPTVTVGMLVLMRKSYHMTQLMKQNVVLERYEKGIKSKKYGNGMHLGAIYKPPNEFLYLVEVCKLSLVLLYKDSQMT